jgi:hypothetical protein
MATFSGKFRQMAIILSTGRTGTMSLAHYLDRWHENVRALHEPAPSRTLRIASNRYLCGKLNRQDMIARFARARRGLFATITQPIYVESNNFLHGFQDVLDDLFDQPCVLHVVRDPRTFIRSWINFGVYRGLKGLAGKYYPYWLLKPELLAKDSKVRWKDMHPCQRIAWYWTKINQELDRGAELFGPRYLRLRFEDLFVADGRGLNAFLDWLSLPRIPGMLKEAATAKVNASRNAGCPAWQDWPAEIQQAVLHECGPLMESYGYSIQAPVSAGKGA